MDESKSTIADVVNLMGQMQQAVNVGEIQLLQQEWAQIYGFLAEYERLLESNDVRKSDLKNVAWHVVVAFEANDTLSQHFRRTLDHLQSGTFLSGNLPGKLEDEKKLTLNTVVYLSFIQQAKEEGAKKSPKAGKKTS